MVCISATGSLVKNAEYRLFLNQVLKIEIASHYTQDVMKISNYHSVSQKT